MMVKKTQLKQTKSNLSSKTESCKKKEKDELRALCLDQGADDTSNQSVREDETPQDAAPDIESESDWNTEARESST